LKIPLNPPLEKAILTFTYPFLPQRGTKMICFWHNNALCLSPEDDKEYEALATIYYAFRTGLKTNPEEKIITKGIDERSIKDPAF
jgi:hypothetical protein